jgi:hypothetical protein
MATGDEVVDVTPHRSLLRKIGSASFTVSESISELIANALDARLDNAPIEIQVNIGNDRIDVQDDARGMTLEVLRYAIRMAWPMQEILEYGTNRKREFGLGMKTACASLGEKWKLTTVATESPDAFEVEFDLEKWASSGPDEVEWTVPIRRIEKSKSELSGQSHGSVISVSKLKVKPILGPLKSELARAFMPHLRGGDTILVNGSKVSPPEYDLKADSHVEINLAVLGHRITGWGALMKESSQKSLYGFHLYRRGQLIEAYDKSFIPIHPTSARIIGEVHLDFVPVNFTKKGFEKESQEWYHAKESLRRVLKPLVGQARQKQGKFQRTKMEDQKVADMKSAVTRTAAAALQENGAVAEAAPRADGSKKVVAGRKANTLAPTPTKHGLIVAGREVYIQHQFAPLGEAGPVRSHFYDGSASELVVFTNTDSVVSRLKIAPEVLVLFHVSEAVAEFLFDEGKLSGIEARRFAMDWQRRAAAAMLSGEKGQ